MRLPRSATLLLSCFKLFTTADAFIRFGCSQLVTQRFDPLGSPGKVSPHLHQIVGGSAFDLTMPPTLNIAQASTCTSCRFIEDKSNYWTSVLYFKHPNGSFIRVKQLADHNSGPGIQSGGMTVYYFQPNKPTRDLNITIFPKGFRMILGGPLRRTSDIPSNETAHKAVTFRCLHGADPGPFGSPGNGPDDTLHLPLKQCSGGIRNSFFFPQCWDGMALDSTDHSSHVAHPAGTTGSEPHPPPRPPPFFGTDCPASHPIRFPLLFMEISWDTRPFNTPELWPKDGSQPFVFSMGDPTGYGQHADYIFGWEGDSLRRAMNNCTDTTGIPTTCPVLTTQNTEAMNHCHQPVKVDEITEGQYIEALPGCNPVQAGPEPATLIAPENCTNAPWTTINNAPLPTDPPEVVIPPWSVCYDGPGTHTLAPSCDSARMAPGPEETRDGVKVVH